ncbi:MAG: 5'/3'-nucleotidase SurE [Caulobacteraceae bacterium]|nr:5'/3'-nucleotidase SurE [Caulobacteraceae bacterium]
MRILLTNDDGVHAEGLTALERIAAVLSDEVWVVAPETEKSGASRALTLNEPLRVRRLGERRFAVSGTPTDCVQLAVQDLVEAGAPDLVLSGVNRGQNLAEDVTLSGTVAGAIEGMAFGIPSIALSQAMNFAAGETPNYDAAEAHAPGVIQHLLKAGWPKDVIINLNFPALRPEAIGAVEVTRQGFRDVRTRFAERRTDLRGRDYYWLGYNNLPSKPPEGVDLRAIYEGRISVTPLHIDLTHMATVHALKAVLGGPPPKAMPRAKTPAGEGE